MKINSPKRKGMTGIMLTILFLDSFSHLILQFRHTAQRFRGLTTGIHGKAKCGNQVRHAGAHDTLSPAMRSDSSGISHLILRSTVVPAYGCEM